MKKYCILTLLAFLGTIHFSKGADFRLGIKKSKDSVQYFIVNQTQETINAGAITCTWYHQSDSIVFWPADSYAGFGTSAVPSSYFINGIKFDFRTSQRISFDFDIAPGDSQVFVSVQNFCEVPKEVMCANVQLFYIDPKGSPKEATIYPNTTSNCPFKQVYLITGLTQDGVKFWAPANQVLHKTGACTSGFYMVVIDRSTLNPTPVGTIVPNCPDGRKWKTFGHPIDEQVFYHFDFLDTHHINGFVELVNAISPGDHVFFMYANREALNLSHTKVKNAFKLLGSSIKLDTNKILWNPQKTFAAYGNKLSDAGTLEWYVDDVIRKEYFLVPDKVYDPSISYAPCYTETIRKMDKAQEMIDETGNIHGYEFHTKSNINIFPNPTSKTLFITGISFPGDVQLYAIDGKQVQVPVIIHDHKLELHLEGLPKGMYILKYQKQHFKIFKVA